MTNPSAPPQFAEVFRELHSEAGLGAATTRRVFDAIFDGAWSAAQIAALLVALRQRGESAEVIAAAARAMRAVMVPVAHGFDALLDTCGTGGDGSGSLNLSTGAALLAAAAGIKVAKHGNRAATSRSGSADVLEALGVPLDVPASAQAAVIEAAGITFLFAQAHHPAMRHAMPARRELGIRTLFNLLGPLSNPASVTHQLLGAPDDDVRTRIASALSKLGVRRAWVLRSEDGLDEVSPFAATRITEVEGGTLRELRLTPEDFGFARSAKGAIDGGEPRENAEALRAILGGEPHPAADAVALNAAAALVVAQGLSPAEAGARARAVRDSGAALDTLEIWRQAATSRRAKAS